jgi:heme/copper-type cytochrome/quinol oxidase subunit 2
LAAFPRLRYPDFYGRGASAGAKLGGSLENPKGMRAVSLASVTVALLQSLCTAVLTINGIRVGIGVAALAAGSIWAPVRAFHRDAIRIPMLTIAVLGAVVNLAVLAWIWRLRARPEAQWRRRALTKKQQRSERLQVAMAVLTLLLVGVETWAHVVIHRPHEAKAAAQSSDPGMRLPDAPS